MCLSNAYFMNKSVFYLDCSDNLLAEPEPLAFLIFKWVSWGPSKMSTTVEPISNQPMVSPLAIATPLS